MKQSIRHHTAGRFGKIAILFMTMLMVACQHTQPMQKSMGRVVAKNQIAHTYTQLAEQYLQLGRIDDAKRQLDLAIQASDRHAAAYRTLARVYQTTNEHEHNKLAKTYYQKALSLDDKDMQTHYDYGVYLTGNQEYSLALKHFERAAREIGFDGRLAAIENIAYIRNILWENLPTKTNLDLAVSAFNRAVKAGSLNADLLTQALYLNIEKDKQTQDK
ncbi:MULTISPECIES: hypothetical protein [unclassified Moraxella]|uniref:hypothetical protein n=1 Tax=unclassified Moraxella TaxID=2685852 RepID=UPI00359D0100